MASERLHWTNKETNFLLVTFKRLDIINLLREKVYRRDYILKLVEKEFIKNDIFEKNAQSIDTKWKQLRNTYFVLKNDPAIKEKCKRFRFYDDIDDLFNAVGAEESKKKESPPPMKSGPVEFKIETIDDDYEDDNNDEDDGVDHVVDDVLDDVVDDDVDADDDDVDDDVDDDDVLVDDPLIFTEEIEIVEQKPEPQNVEIIKGSPEVKRKRIRKRYVGDTSTEVKVSISQSKDDRRTVPYEINSREVNNEILKQYAEKQKELINIDYQNYQNNQVNFPQMRKMVRESNRAFFAKVRKMLESDIDNLSGVRKMLKLEIDDLSEYGSDQNEDEEHLNEPDEILSDDENVLIEFIDMDEK